MGHVVWLCEFSTLNGGEYSLLATLPTIRAAGIRVSALAPDVGPLAEQLRNVGVDVVPFATRDSTARHRGLDVLRQELAARLLDLRPELLHANSVSMGRLSGPVARESGLASLAHLRDIVKLSKQVIADLGEHRRLLAVSCATRDCHVRQGLPRERTSVLYNGVDTDLFRRRPRTGALRRELGIPAASYCVLTIGQIVMRKGQDILARAAQLVSRELPMAHFVIVGARYSEKEEARRYEDEVRALFAAAGLSDRVHWLGVRNDVPELLNECDLLVHSARQEPLGRVLLEGAAAEVPIVASDVGGTCEIFPRDRQLAKLVVAGDAEGLAEAMVEAARNRIEVAAMAGRARDEIERRFSVAEAGEGLVRYYHEAMSL